jgi:CDP-diacylglycerol--glycerol-3-phosphate 3-phosphatidyltransferase
MKFKHTRSFYIINGITVYRIAAAPLLLWLIFSDQYNSFIWFLGISFFTDLIDGFLARKFKVTSEIGTRLDSIGDDLTIISAVIGLYVFKHDFFESQRIFLILLFILFLIQNIFALTKFRKITSFHTYLAKISAVLQGVFLLLVFFLDQPLTGLFYITVLSTGLELIEEIILVLVLKEWKANVKGIYWVLQNKSEM